jgi:3-isopropylmalate dehydrogenase
MNLKIAVLSGDGIGPEVILQAKKALYAIGVTTMSFYFEDALVETTAIDKTGTSLPQLNLCLNTDAVLFGAVGDPDNNQTLHCVLLKVY